MLLKVKSIVGLAILAAVAGFFASLAGVDYTAAFGPSVGAIVSAAVAYSVKESLPRLSDYISRAFGVTVPPQDQ